MVIFLTISEQIGVDIMNNLHRDREVIERARERVSSHFAFGCKHWLMLATVSVLNMIWLQSHCQSGH